MFLVYRLKSVYEDVAPAMMGMTDSMGMMGMMDPMGMINAAQRPKGWRVDQQQLMFKLVWRVDTLY
jgi:hypothetical protein